MSISLASVSEQSATIPAVPAPQIFDLSRQQKAALVVRYLLAGGSNLSLSSLPENTLAALGQQMTTLRHINQATIDAAIAEFTTALEGDELSFPSKFEGALSILTRAIPAATASRLRNLAGIELRGDPWARIEEMDIDLLLPILEEESIEIGAIILSKLKVSMAAEILGRLPGERARKITYAVSMTGGISPETVYKIGKSLAAQLDAQPARAFEEEPVERVGAILNYSPSATRDDVLDGLEQADSGFATQVRRAIFTFANIPERIDPRDVPKITRDVDPAMLVQALACAVELHVEATEFILSNMSQRMATQLRDEMAETGEINLTDGEAAMNSVVATIRNLESTGEIFLVAEDD